jgi:hypothetical protein
MLRVATVNALSNGFQEPYPTIAGPIIFDSKMDNLQNTFEESLVPVVIVYTEDDEHTQQNKSGSGQGGVYRKIQLLIELAIGSYSEVKSEDGEPSAAFSMLQTDAEIEAMMDLFEQQIRNALRHPTNVHSAHWQGLVSSILSWESQPGRSAKGDNRLAMRQIIIEVRIKDDCTPDFQTLRPNEIPEAQNPVPVLGDLPDYLGGLVEVVNNPETEWPTLLETLRELQGEAPVNALPRLTTLNMKVDNIDPQADPYRLPAGETKGPDGRIETELLIKTED